MVYSVSFASTAILQLSFAMSLQSDLCPSYRLFMLAAEQVATDYESLGKGELNPSRTSCQLNESEGKPCRGLARRRVLSPSASTCARDRLYSSHREGSGRQGRSLKSVRTDVALPKQLGMRNSSGRKCVSSVCSAQQQ